MMLVGAILSFGVAAIGWGLFWRGIVSTVDKITLADTLRRADGQKVLLQPRKRG